MRGKNKIRYNMGQCSYQNNVSIVEQLDIVLGNNEMLKYALDNSNNYAFKKLTQEYGKDLQDLKYTEPEFYPCYLNKEEKEYAIKRWLIPIGERNAEDLDSIKAYRIQENDKWCQLITKNGEPIEFFEISDYEPIDSKVLYKKDKGLYGIKEPNSRLEDSSIQIAHNSQENCNQVYYNGHKMENIPFEITKEDIEEENEYMQMLSENNLQYKYQGFF